MSRIHEDHATSPVHPGVSQHESGSSQLAQPGDRIGVDTTPRGGPGSSPPVAGIHRPVRDLADSKAPSVLCSPLLASKEWFPDLLELLSDIPIELPKRRDLLQQPHFNRFHENLPMLRLTAWRLSRDSPVRQGFSETVAGHLAPCRRNSTRLNYQAHWGKSRKRC